MAKEQYFAHPPRGHVAFLAYDSVNDRWQVVHANAAGQLQVYLAGHAGTLLVQQYMPSLLQPGINTYDGAAWRKQPLVWGYTGRLAAKVAHTKSGAGTYNMDVFTVPAGYVYVVNATLSYDSATAINHRHFVSDGTDFFEIKYFSAQAAGYWAVNAGVSYVLQAGDVYRVQFVSAADADVLYGRAWGYTMKINM